MRDKRIKYCDIGKSGFVIAISEDVIDPQQSAARVESSSRRETQHVRKNTQQFEPNKIQPPLNDLDRRVVHLESEVQKKKTIIVEGDRRHNELLDKIKTLENRLENID